jgi:hypothetical protein
MSDRLYVNPLITVKAGIISVSPEPLVLRKSDAGDEIVWNLPPGLTFQDRGISVDGLLQDAKGERLRPNQDAHVGVATKLEPGSDKHFKCEVRGKQQYACKVDKKVSQKGIYKYTIRLKQDGKDLPAADPSIYHPD